MEKNRRSILLVEDDESSREALASLLAICFGHLHILSAEDGRTGLELFIAHLPEVVITDISMPDMDGIEMMDRIRSIKPETRFILITAHSNAEVPGTSGAHPEFITYVVKPINLDVLFASIRKCLDSSD